MKEKAKKIILIILISLFVVLTLLIITNLTNDIDNNILNKIMLLRNDSLTETMTIITNISSSYVLIGITLILLLVLKLNKESKEIAINLLLVFLISQLFKLIIARERPIINLIDAIGYSYPSGHAMVSTAYYSFIAYLLTYKNKSKIKKIFINLINIILIALISFSRIYLGVHYLSDIIGGILLSNIYLIYFIKYINKKKVKK